MTTRWSIYMLAMFTTTACASRSAATEPVATLESADLPRQVELGVGESFAIRGTLSFKFVEVISDSRCPVDVVCIQAGTVVAAFAVHPLAAPSRDTTFQLTLGAPPVALPAANGITVKMSAVHPAMRSTVRINRLGYRVVLVMGRG